MPALDLEGRLTARLYVARLGESDVNRWWRTDGILGKDGAFVGPRVLPKTHGTGRARIAFAVTRHACWAGYPDPAAENLFRLDPETEDQLDAYLARVVTMTEALSPARPVPPMPEVSVHEYDCLRAIDELLNRDGLDFQPSVILGRADLDP